MTTTSEEPADTPAAVTAAPDALTHESASRDLLTSLMGVKAWLRDTHRWLYDAHSPASMMTLSMIDRHGPARISALAEIARVDTSVISRQIGQLEQDGLVERHPDPADGRAHQVSLTETGRSVLAEGRERLAGLVTDRLSDWSPDEIETFTARLRRLLATLRD